MAMIACKECGHQISDKAASCPNCGVPIAPAQAGPRSPRRALYVILLALAALWLAGTALWIARTIRTSNEPLATASDRNTQPAASSGNSSAPASQAIGSGQAPTAESAAAPRLVYQTTAEQLNQDYSINGVATQSRIGTSRIRVTGSVAEIDEDVSGHPVVMLATGADRTADMTLTTDQTAAAAQLVKGETVDIECDRMQRLLASPRGTDCALVRVDARSKQVYLGVFLGNDAGTGPVYVIGPMSESECQSRRESIATRLSITRRGDRVELEDCTFATRDSVPVGGCRLASFVQAAPDIPTAHLWKYDCAPPEQGAQLALSTRSEAESPGLAGTSIGAAAAKAPSHARRRSAATGSHATAPSFGSAEVSSQETPKEPAAPQSDDQQVPAPVVAAAPVSVQRVGTAAAGAVAAAPGAVTGAQAGAGTAGTAGVAAQSAALQGTEATVQHVAEQAPATSRLALASTQTSLQAPAAPAATANVGDDLAVVRATDPQAAQRIASYCGTTGASAPERATFEAGCRRDEVDAWTRLVLRNEFPVMDDAVRRKCSEAPFPDSYVAKELCAKYELHLD